jgi:hypothetical protein
MNSQKCNEGRERAARPESEWRTVEKFDYTNKRFKLLYQVVRKERGKGAEREKEFLLRRPDGNGGWIWDLDGVRRVPYRLPEVVAAQTVIIVEGEKCVDTVRELNLPKGYAATTNSEGAGKFQPELVPHFDGKNVILIPDNDNPGREHVLTTASMLLDNTASIQIVELPGLTEKGDVGDWKDNGATFLQLKKLIRAEPVLDATSLAARRKKWGLHFEWAEPLALDDVQPAPIRKDLIGGSVGDYIRALSAATETPLELTTLAAFGVLSCALGGKMKVSPERGYSEPCQLFLCPTLESGNRKSSVISAVTEPLMKWEEEQKKLGAPKIAYATSVRKTRMALIEKERKKLAGFEREKIERIARLEAKLPVIPQIPTQFTCESTSERLEIMLAEQGGRAAVISDEGGAFDVMGGRYSEKMNFEVFLKGHAGTAIRVHRVSREPVVVDSPALTVLLSPQPGCLAELRENKPFRARGLLARFLYALPHSPIGNRTLVPVPIPDSVKSDYDMIVRRLLDWNPGGRVPLSLSPEAYKAWKDFQREVEVLMANGGILCRMRDWGSKLPGAALRVAGILHASTAEDLSVLAVRIQLPVLRVAVELCRTLISHAIAVFNLISEDPSTRDAKRLWKWMISRPERVISKRDCYRAHHPHVFKNVQEMDAALKILEEHNLTHVSKEKTGGRQKGLIEVNPAIAVNAKA